MYLRTSTDSWSEVYFHSEAVSQVSSGCFHGEESPAEKSPQILTEKGESALKASMQKGTKEAKRMGMWRKGIRRSREGNSPGEEKVK